MIRTSGKLSSSENKTVVKSIEQIRETVIHVGIDKSYQTIQSALLSIIDSSYYNRYMILVDAGIYDIGDSDIDFLPIKPYVTIKGMDKSACIISFCSKTKDANKNVFQQYTKFKNGYAEVCNFTLITENIKGGLHLDSDTWTGEIHFHDVIINDISSEEIFNSTLDYYHYMRASVGAINIATHLGQKIVIENIQTNGYIYSHSSTKILSDLNNKNGGIFIVKNCSCDWIGVYGNGDKVRKYCTLESNKCHFIKICFIDQNNLGYMCWTPTLLNNQTDFVAMQYFPYGKSQLSQMENLANRYFGKFPCVDINLHKVIQNTTGADIPFGSKVKFTDYTRRYVTVTDDVDYDAIACETIKNNWFGVVQDGGNKEAYLNYLSTHEIIN